MRTPHLSVTALLLVGLTQPAGGETFCDTTQSVGGYEITLSGSSSDPWDSKGSPLSSPYIRTLYLWAVTSRPPAAPPEDGGISVFVGRLESATGGTSVLGFSPETGVLNVASAPEVSLAITDGCTGRELPFVMGSFSVVETATGATWALAETDSIFPGTLGLFDCVTVDGGGDPILITDVSYRGYSSTATCPAVAGGQYGFSPALDVSSTSDGDHWFEGFADGEDGEGPNNAVNAIWVRSFDEIFVGGRFTTAGDPPVTVNHVARWDGVDSWQPLGSGFTFSTPTRVEVLTDFTGDLVAGGTALSSTSNIFRFSGSSWDTLACSSGRGILRQPVKALLPDGTTLYAGSDSVYQFDDATGWTKVGSSVWRGGSAASVTALTFFEGELIAGGDFDTTDGSRVHNIARFDGTDWIPLGAADEDNGLRSSGSVDGAYCSALTVYRGLLLVGGRFTQAGQVDTQGLAIWDGCSWRPFFCSLHDVHALAVFEPSPSTSDLVVFGGFSSAGGVTLNRLMRWDGGAWTSLGTGITGGYQLPTSENRGLAADGNRLYIGGEFTDVGSLGANTSLNVAMWREVEESVAVPASGSPLASPQLALAVHPNPTSARVRLALTPPQTGGSVAIYDVGGRRVALLRGGTGVANEFIWDHRGVTPGVYYAVWSEGALRASAPVVVLR